MDEIDKQILNVIQSDFPIESRPFRALGAHLQLAEEEVLSRIRQLKQEGVIRRIGGNFHSARLNFVSTLCAARVPEDRLERFVELVNRIPGVTHNYLRNHGYNVWFTFIAEDMDHIDRCLKRIARETGIGEILNLPAQKMFKIKVDFELQ